MDTLINQLNISNYIFRQSFDSVSFQVDNLFQSFNHYILVSILVLPVIGIITLFFIDEKKKELLGQIALFFSMVTFILSLFL